MRAGLRLAPDTRQPCIVRFKAPPLRQWKFEETAPSLDQLPFEHALRVRSAEFWLKLGKPDEAIMELRRLSRNSRRHPLALKVFLRAIRAVREMNEMMAQA